MSDGASLSLAFARTPRAEARGAPLKPEVKGESNRAGEEVGSRSKVVERPDRYWLGEGGSAQGALHTRGTVVKTG